MRKYIAVAGNMGVGKTSFVEFLSEEFGFEPVYEPYTTNPWLDDFYGDMGRWAYQSQLWFLTNKFRLHLDLNQNAGTVVQDRTIYEDAEIFATNLHRQGHMEEREFRTYMDLYGGMKRTLQPPDLMIYLRCSVRAIRRRIQKRGRPSELAIPTKYLQGLNGLYEDWMEGYDLSPKVVWDSERADYLTHLVDRLEFRKMLKPFL
ncbi:deoxyguanosine kinase [Deltaproteobacteria bacterium]|nr:deoxyguanosine kinase [Deltaproteobacteria bacterium]